LVKSSFEWNVVDVTPLADEDLGASAYVLDLGERAGHHDVAVLAGGPDELADAGHRLEAGT
jgi:3-mercaptopyruvate sulfurtransferase SseA